MVVDLADGIMKLPSRFVEGRQGSCGAPVTIRARRGQRRRSDAVTAVVVGSNDAAADGRIDDDG